MTNFEEKTVTRSQLESVLEVLDFFREKDRNWTSVVVNRDIENDNLKGENSHLQDKIDQLENQNNGNSDIINRLGKEILKLQGEVKNMGKESIRVIDKDSLDQIALNFSKGTGGIQARFLNALFCKLRESCDDQEKFDSQLYAMCRNLSEETLKALCLIASKE